MKQGLYSRKQELCNKLLTQVNYLQNEYQSLSQSYPFIIESIQKQQQQQQQLQHIPEQISKLHDKITKIRCLTNKLQKDQQRLKLQYIMLLKQKHTYVNKLKAIEHLGDNFQWNDQSKILEKIQPLIQIAKKRLKQTRITGQKA